MKESNSADPVVVVIMTALTVILKNQVDQDFVDDFLESLEFQVNRKLGILSPSDRSRTVEWLLRLRRSVGRRTQL